MYIIKYSQNSSKFLRRQSRMWLLNGIRLWNCSKKILIWTIFLEIYNYMEIIVSALMSGNAIKHSQISSRRCRSVVPLRPNQKVSLVLQSNQISLLRQFKWKELNRNVIFSVQSFIAKVMNNRYLPIMKILFHPIEILTASTKLRSLHHRQSAMPFRYRIQEIAYYISLQNQWP